MAVNIVTYDLKVKNNDDADVIKVLKQTFTWLHLQESVWLVDTALTPQQVRDILMGYMKPGDSLFVDRLAGPWATYGVNDVALAWLQNPIRSW